MAQLKQLSAGSSQIIMMMFRDKNNAPIKADSVHVKGSIFTGSGKPFEFEVNKGVCTNCKIQNDMLLFNIVPLLGLGQMQVYTQTYLGDTKAITGTYISENQQKLGVEVVQKGTFLSDRQGAMWVDVYLPIEINDAAQIPWVPAGADEQWIKDYLDKYVKTPAFAATLAALGGASKNLSNVDAKDFEKKAKDGNFAQNDLADVDLAKLKEKGLAAGLADAKNPISPTEFDRMIKQNAAFIALSKTAHPATAGKTNEQIKALFYANRQEVQKGVNLNTDPYNKSTTLLLVYQMSNNQTIQQTLPPVSDNRIIILELIQEPGAANYKAIISPAGGESIDGANTPITVTSNGIAGIFLPIQNENTWDFIPWYKTIDSSLTTSDEQGNIVLQTKNLRFKKPFYIEYDSDTDEANVNLGDVPFLFNDKITKKSFKATEVGSMDGTVRIAQVGNGQTPDGDPIYKADLSVVPEKDAEGILAMLGNDELVNSKYPKSRLWFSDLKVKGGIAVYQDMQKKSFVIQDIDPQDDPNISGGTTFLIGLYIEPTQYGDNRITQDGWIRLEFVDDTDTPLLDVNGNPMAVQIDYNAGDEQRKELYLGECQAKAYTDVHLRIETNFPNEELLSIGANSCVLIQSVGKDYGVGKALLAFMAFTGYQVKMNNKYYGYNSLNLARTLIFPEPETEINNDVTYMGDNTYLSVKTAAKVSISNNQLIVKDNNKDLPVFSLFKRYNRFDTFVCRGKNYKATVKITDKQNAFVVALMKYTGSENVAPTPELVSYNNDQPQFNAGWSISDKLFISEDAVSGIHEATKTFVVPTEAKEFAVIIFPNTSQIPTTMVLNDFEGDITPWFNRMVITDSSHISEKYLEYQKDYAKFVVMTPAGDASYRYTYNKTAGNIPLGIKKGLALVSNNNAWADPGASDPNKVQGDLLAEADGIITIQYSGQAYNETSTMNEANFWAVKVAPDGSLTEVPNSRYSTTIEANRKIAKNIQSKSISFPIQQGESVRFLANSNIDDGFYLQSGTDGKPLFEVVVNFKEMVGMPFIPDELEKGATEFYE